MTILSCVCGAEIENHSIMKHLQTQNHQRFMNELARFGTIESVFEQSFMKNPPESLEQFLKRHQGHLKRPFNPHFLKLIAPS